MERFMLVVLIFTVLLGNFSNQANAAGLLYHIVSKKDWSAYASKSGFWPASIRHDHFIHLSERNQIFPVANSFFKGQHDLLLLEIDIPRNDKLLKYESVEGQKGKFPHYYGGIPLYSIKKAFVLEPDATTGLFKPTSRRWNGDRLNLLKGNWKEKCRPAANEAGVPLKPTQSDFQSLQGSFTTHSKNSLEWTVTAFKDAACKEFYSADRILFKCSNVAFESHCEEVKAFRSSAPGQWKKRKLIDSKGYTSALAVKYAIEPQVDKTLRLIETADETQEPKDIVLTK